MPKDILIKDIEDIVKLTPEALADIEVYGKIGEKVLEIETHILYKEGGILRLFLENFLRKNTQFENDQPDLYKKYSGLVTWLKFIMMEMILDNDVYDIMKLHLIEALTEYDIDVRGKIKTLFLQSWDLLLRGEKRSLLLRAFSQNNETFGNYRIELSSKKRATATVANIIVDYNRVAKSDEQRTSLDEARYINESENLRSFTRAHKDLVLKVLQVYDFVRFPPIEELTREMALSPVKNVEGAPGPAPKRGIPDMPLNIPGAAEDEAARQSIKKDPLEYLQQKYDAYRIQRKQVLDMEDALMVQTRGELENVKRELSNAAREKERTKGIACLKIMARQKALISSLSVNPSWFESVSDYMQKKYSSQYDKKEVAHAVSNLKMQLSSPVVISEFLQYILKERLTMTVGDSALVGVEIGQLIGGEFQSMAYGNQETGNFEWTKNRIVNKEFVSEA